MGIAISLSQQDKDRKLLLVCTVVIFLNTELLHHKHLYAMTQLYSYIQEERQQFQCACVIVITTKMNSC